ncbi:uncharacterized protein LOC144167332 isoform X2 [Haemaphysalis longicornis]
MYPYGFGESSHARGLSAIIDLFPEAVAVLTSSEDPSMKCATATRSKYDKTGMKAEYIWNLNGDQGHGTETFTIAYLPGKQKDHVKGFVDGDRKNPYDVKFDYTNRKNCMVARFPYNGDQCVLWVLPSVKDEVPQECIDNFEDICDEKISTYDKSFCENDNAD